MSSIKPFFTRVSVVTLASIVLATSMTLTSAQARTLNYATPAPPTERPNNDALRWWVDEIEKRTGGSITIKIHWLQGLVKFKDAYQGVTSGVADIAPMNPEYSQARMPLWSMSQTELGSGQNYIAAEAWRRVVESSEALRQELDQNNLTFISNYSSGPRAFISTTRPYLSPEDFNGDKVRLTPRGVRTSQMQDWDVTPVNITWGDIYSGMERGTIDGAQSYTYLMPPYKHHEVTDYAVETGIGQSMVVVMMNKQVWDSLTEEEQKAFNDVAPEYSRRTARAGMEEVETARELMTNSAEHPVELHQLSDEQRKVWEEAYRPAVEEHVAELARRNPAATEVHSRFLEELAAVEQEVEEKGYPWERD